MKFRRSIAIACALAGAMGIAGNTNALTINDTFNGFYVETGATSNRGINIELFKLGPELFAGFVTGFTYDADGNQVWFSGTDPEVLPGDISVDFNINLATGGQPFGGSQIPSNAESQGSGSLVFNTCNSAELTLNTNPGSVIPATTSVALDRGESLLGPIGVVGPDQCAFQQAFTGCPSFSDGPFSINGVEIPRACALSGGITSGSIELTNDILWVLTSAFVVGDPAGTSSTAEINIQPGTRIVNDPTGNPSALFIARGAKIFAIGQPFAPIVFSSFFPSASSTGQTTATAGQFGGLVINGLAPVNNCPALPGGCASEGNADVLYGGDDPFDSSGIIKYLRVQFGGDDINEEDQLNGIALQALGMGTTIDYIQVHANADDGIEWFGGTVRVTHAVVTAVNDDSFDWVAGWTGSLQYALADQQGSGDQGIEADNFDDNPLATPRSQPRIANITLNGSSDGDIGMLFREGTGVNLTNAIVKGFGDACLDIGNPPSAENGADDETFDLGFPGGTPDGTFTIQNTYLACDTAIIEEPEDLIDNSDFFDSFDAENTTFGGFPGIFPPSGAAFLRGRPMDPAIFSDLDLTEFAGAFENEENAWTAGWTEFLD